MWADDLQNPLLQPFNLLGLLIIFLEIGLEDGPFQLVGTETICRKGGDCNWLIGRACIGVVSGNRFRTTPGRNSRLAGGLVLVPC